MARLVVKLLSDDSATDLASALATYVAGAGAELADAQRGQAMDEFIEPDGDHRLLLALAHEGLDLPTATNKTAELQHLDVVVEGDLAALQAAVDAALADATHHTAAATDIDTTVSGTITSVSTPFAATDVGRRVAVDGVERTITAFTDTNNVDYDAVAEGALASGTGQTLDILGAESLQGMVMSAEKSRSGELRMRLLMAVEGEAY